MFKRMLVLLAGALALAGCGSGADDRPVDEDPNQPPAGPTISAITLQTDAPQIASDGSAQATITAFVRGSNNQFLADIPVSFSADSGGLAVTRGTTDASGTAVATLGAAGDPTNRSITVTAAAGNVSETIRIDVTGTQLSVSGPANLAQNAVGTFTVSLRNSAGVGISGREVTVSSARSNTLSATTLTTGTDGQATFTVTAANGGTDTITTRALGLTATQDVVVSSDQLTFTAPAANAEITLNTAQTVAVRWSQAGVAQVGRNISFSVTRGTVSSATAVTDTTGLATVTIQSTNAGPAVISAVAEGGPTVTLPVEFVATTPDMIEVQASPFTIAPEGSSVLTAVVRDAAGNRVKNQTVVFTLNDVTGGSLSVAQGRTDSQGRAQTTYTASSSTSAASGVVVTATVQGTAISDAAAITVAQREVFISLGTGNEIVEPNPAQYSVPYAVQVTDSRGVAVANATVNLEVLSTQYGKGTSAWNGVYWNRVYSERCLDEDEDRDGTLDSGEDDNSSGRIEAGNIATVTPRTVTTDATGTAIVNVVYPQEYAYWVQVQLSASTIVQGSEFARTLLFVLPGLAADFNDEDATPPGFSSPFNPWGAPGTCEAGSF